MLLTGSITTNQEIRNATNQSLSYIGFTLSAVDVIVLLTGWPCQQWVLMSYWQGDPLSSGWWCIIDRVTLSAMGVMSHWQGHPVSNGGWSLIDHVDRVTLSVVGFDVLLTGWPCQQWMLMSYWQGDPVSSGWWCIIDRVTLSAMGADVLLTGSPCQQWVLMSYWQGDPVSSESWCLIDRLTLSAVGLHVIGYSCMGDNRRFWIALISVDFGAVLNFGSSAWPNECSHTEREHICDHMGDAQPSAIASYLQQQCSCCRVH